MLNSFAILCCGDYGGVIAARRVLLVDVGTEVGLITCVLSRIGQAASHSTPSSEQRRRGLIWSSRDREQAGDGTTGGKRTKGD